MSHPADKFYTRANGPLAIAAGCKLCKFMDTVRKPPPGSKGRGWGLREVEKQKGRMIQHVKACHPEALA